MVPLVHSMRGNINVALFPDEPIGERSVVEFEVVLNAVNRSYEFDPVTRGVRDKYDTHTFRFGGSADALDKLIRQLVELRQVMADACANCADEVATEMGRVALVYGEAEKAESKEV